MDVDVKGGGVMLLISNINIALQSYSKHQIDYIISDHNSIPWCLTRIYGAPRVEHQHYVWNLLQNLSK